MWFTIFFLALGGCLVGMGTERMRIRSHNNWPPSALDDYLVIFGMLGVITNGAIIAGKLGLM